MTEDPRKASVDGCGQGFRGPGPADCKRDEDVWWLADERLDSGARNCVPAPSAFPRLVNVDRGTE
ncbi:hypothetical protein VCV18_005761 [Metarhizium anisopliae]